MKTLCDVDVSYWLTRWCEDAQIDPKDVSFKINHKERIIHIYVPHPGVLIGYHGERIDRFQEQLNQIYAQRKITRRYDIALEEVTIADFWFHYNWEAKGF